MVKKFGQLLTEIGTIASNTKFNGVSLLAAASTINLQTGSNSGDTLPVSLVAMTAAGLGVTGLNVSTDAAGALTAIDTALDTVSTQRANMGAYINRLEFTIDNLTTNATNLSAANSRIQDANMAEASSEMTKQNVLVQAGVAMLAQANQSPQNVLSLLR